MLLTTEVEMKWSTSNKDYYIKKGYSFTKMKDTFKVKVEDLTKGSMASVNVKCDGYNCDYSKNIIWQGYLRNIKEDGKYYCHNCSMKLFGITKLQQTFLKNSKSFEQWCIENNRQDVLDKWDYELNNCKPSEITYSTGIMYYFKCSRGIHDSELKHINYFVRGQEGSVRCNKCNSFAQWGIDNVDEDFLEKYWDWDKNDKLNFDPWKIGYSSNKYVWLKCQDRDYHGSYEIPCNSFINGFRCSFCAKTNGKVHPLDSLGTLYPESINSWSDKNEKTPFEFAPFSNKYAWWKCENNKHQDFKRSIIESNKQCFHCPKCSYFKGETKIGNYLLYNNIDYILHKTFKGLIGINNGKLSYDFYLPQFNLLIEYQGQQHKEPVDFNGKGKKCAQKDFERQQEHDRRKREYAKQNNYNLLEIWYWDFDNIETILTQYLTKN